MHDFNQVPIPLPAPSEIAGFSVFEAFRLRRTIREISTRPLPDSLLSNLLWAGFGVNRTTGPFGLTGRTAGSASNSQEIDIYVARKEGAYLFDAIAHALKPVSSADLRGAAMTPHQHVLNPKAPIQLIYVADLDRLIHSAGFQEPGLQDPDVQKSYYFVDTGMIAANIHIYAAAHGLAAWFHNCDKPGIAEQLGFRSQQKAIFAQSIGYPANA